MPPYHVDSLEIESQTELRDIESLRVVSLLVNSSCVRLPDGKLANYLFGFDSEAAIDGVTYSILANALIKTQALTSDLVYGVDNKICGVVSMRASKINDISSQESSKVNDLKEHPTVEILLASGLARLMALCWRLKLDLDPRYFEFVFIKLSENTKNLIQRYGSQAIDNGQATYQIEACNLIEIDNEPYAVLAVMSGYFYLEDRLWKKSVVGRFQRACVVTSNSLIEQLNLDKFNNNYSYMFYISPAFLRSGFFWALNYLSNNPIHLKAFQLQFYSALLEQLVIYNSNDIKCRLTAALGDIDLVDSQLSLINEDNDYVKRVVMLFQGSLASKDTLLVSFSEFVLTNPEALYKLTMRTYDNGSKILKRYTRLWSFFAEREYINKYRIGDTSNDISAEFNEFCELVQFVMQEQLPFDEKYKYRKNAVLSEDFIVLLQKAIAEVIEVHFYPRDHQQSLTGERKKIERVTSKPDFLRQLAIKNKKISAEVVANAIWLSSKSEKEVKDNLNAFSFWALYKNIPVEREAVKECMNSKYVMPRG